ncbi:hypothetical protein NW762_013488 [Fusarium torreyae]|uniref:FAD/NAD(P)-binding domain-containing protein n=1 Tax=Fusarium torreyae TaxID=1237075 RepID=A0A9W8RKH3_9HYPO|nr:hypothetical protein NW762_013488 [Fusarium torreyae]
MLLTLALSSLLAAATAVPFTPDTQHDAIAAPYIPDTQYDAIIVGGGPAGLSALSGLARVRRNVLLIDSGEYRNGPTRYIHDVLGFNGVQPAYYRWNVRNQLSDSDYHTVKMMNGTVTDIKSDALPHETTKFTVSVTYPDGFTRNMTTRKVVLATGLKDIIPTTPGIAENWGKGIYFCPWCDGIEHADQNLCLLSPLNDILGMLLKVQTLHTDIVALVNGTDNYNTRHLAGEELPQWQEYLKHENVTVDNRIITEVKRLEEGATYNKDPSDPSVPLHDLFRVKFAQGDYVDCAAVWASFPYEQRSDVGAKAGVKIVKGRMVVNAANGYLTGVPGIYAVGDANSDNADNVPHALFTSKRAVIHLHSKLAKEQRAFTAGNLPSKRDTARVDCDLWDIMNGEPGDLLYAGPCPL